MNQARASRGLPALRLSGGLSAKAQAWANHMAATGRFEHSVLTEDVPAGWRGLAENIGYAGSVRAVHDAWVASPGHLANMTGAEFDNVGVGLARVGNRLYAVHVFGDYLP
ncbi:MAG: CAP domain-containing protein [Actinomycetota bacterium]|nr:CAP domain-containing protein [Actinomycetota bacterium]